MEDIEKNKVTKYRAYEYNKGEKYALGCKAYVGVPVQEVSEESGLSRQCIYNQKAKVAEHIAELGIASDKGTKSKSIMIDKEFIEKMVVGLAMYAKSALEGIQLIFEYNLGTHISIGTISNILQEAGRRAQVFDDSIRLEGIIQGANDEIFQGDTPIMTGVDPETTYTYLLEEATDRTSETWNIYFEDCKTRGLELETSLNDGASGLIAGVRRAYPEAVIQQDVFHALRPIGKELAKISRKAYSLIAGEAELEKRVQIPHPRKKTVEKLEEIRPKVQEAIEKYDVLAILFAWLKILIGFSGYSFNDTLVMVNFVIDEIIKNAINYPELQKEAERFRSIVPSLLSFINRLEKEFEKLASEQGVSLEALKDMYRQLAFEVNSQQHQEIEYSLVMKLMYAYDKNREAFSTALNRVKRASSLVENLNGRIRPYMNIKRTIPTYFFVLMKVYFNTKPFRRSRYEERKGKSPLELLTKMKQPDFFTALGY